ncbi:MAG: 2-phospho-L-lactate transferase CofD family protein, partial [Actinobacteria bacterium]|nr:2-phospho-L-lactate transferase CofD family protein [Actinomycetota bacterium]
VQGSVIPSTTELVTLLARVNGGEVKGQVAVARTSSPIQAVYLEPADPVAHPDAVAAIIGADQIVLGPGSLFTSLIATLLVPGIRAALQETKGRRVFVCNARQQKGETETLDAANHVQALLAHAGPFCVDTVVAQSPELPVDGVAVDVDALKFLGIDVVVADVATSEGAHDPIRLAEVLKELPNPVL